MSSFINALTGAASRQSFGNNMLGSNPKDMFEKNFASQAAFFMASDVATQFFSLGLSPYCMLGPVPLYTVDYFEAAKSDKTLKFKSIGGQFFAFQEADSLGIRIDCKLVGPLRFLWLHALNVLYTRGLGRWKMQEANELETNDNFVGPIEGNQFATGDNPDLFAARTGFASFAVSSVTGAFVNNGTFVATDIRPTSVNVGTRGQTVAGDNEELRSTTPWEEVPYWARRRRVLSHKTFTVLTKEEIFVRMFIETLIWSRSINRDGEDEITVNILLRRYVEPPDLIMFTLPEPKPQQMEGLEVSRYTLDNNGNFVRSDNPKLEAVINQVEKINPNTLDVGGRTISRKAAARTRTVNFLNNLRNRQVVLDPNDPNTYQTLRESEGAAMTRWEEAPDLQESEQRRTYFGTAPEDGNSGDFKLLNINFGWRLQWTVRNLTYSLYGYRRLANDPLVGRIMQIIGSVKSNPTITDGSSFVESYLPQVV